jgi:hypothetical protein
MIRLILICFAVLGLAACEGREGSRGAYVSGSGGINAVR